MYGVQPMKAIVYDHYGPPDVLRFEEIEKPVPTDDQLLIQVRASSVNPYDWHFIRGTPSFIRLFAGLRAPKSSPRVTAVCSTRNIELVRSIGADDVIDYTRENFIQSSQRYDVLFDLVGNNSLPACLRVLQPNGIYIGCGGGGPDRRSIELLGSMLHSLLLAPFTTQKMPGLLAKVNR